MISTSQKRYAFPSDWTEAKTDFKRVFGRSLVDFFDGLASYASGEVCVDVVELDRWLRGYAEEADGLSMSDLVLRRYGDEGVIILDRLS